MSSSKLFIKLNVRLLKKITLRLVGSMFAEIRGPTGVSGRQLLKLGQNWLKANIGVSNVSVNIT